MNLPSIEIETIDRTGATLFEQIRSIDDLFGETETHKNEKEKWIHRAFEVWKEKNSVVRDVNEGKTTFTQEYHKLFGEYNSFSKLSTPYSLPTGFKENLKDLESCIGESNLNDSTVHKISGNTVGGLFSGTVFGLLYTGYKAVRSRYPKKGKEPENPSRRTFLKNAVLMGTGGLIYGASESLSAKEQLDKLDKHAKYLDRMYANVYYKK